MPDVSDNHVLPADLAFHQNLAWALLKYVHVRGFLPLLDDELLPLELAGLDVLQNEVIDLWDPSEDGVLQDDIEEEMFGY